MFTLVDEIVYSSSFNDDFVGLMKALEDAIQRLDN